MITITRRHPAGSRSLAAPGPQGPNQGDAFPRKVGPCWAGSATQRSTPARKCCSRQVIDQEDLRMIVDLGSLVGGETKSHHRLAERRSDQVLIIHQRLRDRRQVWSDRPAPVHRSTSIPWVNARMQETHDRIQFSATTPRVDQIRQTQGWRSLETSKLMPTRPNLIGSDLRFACGVPTLLISQAAELLIPETTKVVGGKV